MLPCILIYLRHLPIDNGNFWRNILLKVNHLTLILTLTLTTTHIDIPIPTSLTERQRQLLEEYIAEGEPPYPHINPHTNNYTYQYTYVTY